MHVEASRLSRITSLLKEIRRDGNNRGADQAGYAREGNMVNVVEINKQKLTVSDFKAEAERLQRELKKRELISTYLP